MGYDTVYSGMDLGLTLDTEQTTTGASVTTIFGYDPSGTEHTFAASVSGTTAIAATIPYTTLTTAREGTWLFRPYVVFADGTRGFGVPVRIQVRPEWWRPRTD